MEWSYEKAGVNIDAGNEAARRIRQHLKATRNLLVRGEEGGFGGLFAFPAGEYKKPVLVASTDGVGTKLKVAFAMEKHDTVGRDLVNHCVNDILVQGAAPLFFLDYIGTGKVAPAVIEEIVSGLAAACQEAGCVLLGGETAEMPGFYQEGEYDLVGTIVGVVEEEKLLPKVEMAAGDLLYGLASSGLHTNGYTLARRIFFEVLKKEPGTYMEELGRSVGEELLIPHRSYLPVLKEVIQAGLVKGLAHLTGGGFIDNIPRVLPANRRAVVKKDSWPVPPVFQVIQEAGKVPETEMYRTFNMGIGMVCIVSPGAEAEFKRKLEAVGEKPYCLGWLEEGEKAVVFSS
ncbi:MAG: phosphoribosylformylglycinamidine cyclo-ligase [Firmicutes bacterium]|jgi:phosphoribosylformylglycinamidine cyclo-ligase|nr:phosphoribosylformylglycinamidine cyclo-ligase [Bacillota bacterium]